MLSPSEADTPPTQHIYERDIDIDSGERTSLSVLVARIAPGARVLDLGCGSGAVGRFLARRDGRVVPIDGLTINPAEAERARAHYRRVEVADLDQLDLTQCFEHGAYDVIVCADVLEHIRQSPRVLRACRDLLAPGGVALLSIPNVGYCGLIAELMAGEFRYREEGLLDATHVHFFTRATLLRFLAENGWGAGAFETITRALPDSEFRVAFDALPPAVARYLLALPDALTYQFIVTARPDADVADAAPVGGVPPLIELLAPQQLLPARALFSAELFPGSDGRYNEAHKLTARGEIGRARQTLRFDLPAAAAPLTGLKLDLADRPGFIHLHGLTLTDATGEVLWSWTPDDVAALVGARHDGLVFAPPASEGGGFVALMYDEDPWLELPIAQPLLARAAGGALTVALGWPMSADYLALARLTRLRIGQARASADQAQARINQIERERQLITDQLQTLNQSLRQQIIDQLQALNQNLRQQIVEQLQALNQNLRQQTIEQLQTLNQNLRLQITDPLQALNQTLRLQAQSLASMEGQNEQLRQQRLELVTHMHDLSRERDEARALVRAIETSTLFRLTRPIIHAKEHVQELLGLRNRPVHPADAADDDAAEPHPLTPPDTPVDVIVPVYAGLEDTRRCVVSVLRATCRTPWRLILINDASPEPELVAWLRQVAAADARVTLLENEHNLGFVGTVNRGMALASENDVLLLNSDTEVAGDWLDRLRAAAYSDQRVATVTPFSNNATICSYPRFCEYNDLPEGWDTARLDALFARVNAGQVVDVPTGVGFCFYIRRAALDQVGPFDEENFGKGYGEENDFCVRTQAAGWRNLHALDVFVRHLGGVSFGDRKKPRERAALETLRRLHPRYESDVLRFIEVDPARLARYAVDLARVLDGGKPVILAVLHDRQGGTERHVFDQARLLRDQARFLVLRPEPGECLSLRLAGEREAFELRFTLGMAQDPPSETGIRDEHGDGYAVLLALLRALGVCHVHYHHRLGHGTAALQLAQRLGVGYDFTVHDYYAICPQITLTGSPGQRYCGEAGDVQCAACLQALPAPERMSIVQWRQDNAAMLNRARFAIVPSRDALARLMRHAPAAPLRWVAHPDIDPDTPCPTPHPRKLQGERPLKVAVIGALSIIKGADVLEDVAVAARKAGAPVEFHLIGYSYRSLKTQPHANLSVYGRYDDADLPKLLGWLQPDVVWFPALWPETYCYTLSACLQGGWPVVAPDIGAFPERLAGRDWTWIRPWQTSAQAWLNFFIDIGERHYRTGQPPAPPTPDLPELPAFVQTGASPRSWYTGPYLAELPHSGRAPEDVTPELRGLVATQLAGGPDGLGASARGLTLRALTSARSHPLLASVARAIPQHWQTRVKNWLRQ